MLRIATAFSALALSTLTFACPADAIPLTINIKSTAPKAVFIYWDDTGRCAVNAHCGPLKYMKPKLLKGHVIAPGTQKSYGGDSQSVQVGDSPTAHIFYPTRGKKIPATETSTKNFSAVDLSKDPTKAGTVDLEWTGTELKKD